MSDAPKDRLVLVTGASGYVGGRLVRALLNENIKVRIFVRDRKKVLSQPWADMVEIFEGNADDFETTKSALMGVHTAFYLLHSINAGTRFDKLEENMAANFAHASRVADVKQIVYLGGIANDEKQSMHLESRANTGKRLAYGTVPVLEFRAGVIIGSGSASFEMIRHMTHRLPVMITPKWVRNRTQPIAIRDVLYYLTTAAQFQKPVEGVFDIGGPDVLSYEEMIQTFAKVSHLRKRIFIKVPFLTPAFSSLFIGFVTPVPTSLARPLVGSLVNEVIADPAKNVNQIIPLPAEGLLTIERAFTLALEKVEAHLVESRWSDAALYMPPWQKTQGDPEWSGAAEYKDERIFYTDASLKSLWRAIEQIGGDHGWYGADVLWYLRGLMDSMIGGVGLRRGRRDPDFLRQGESLDFWRVELLEREHVLTLVAEMILPGKAWLRFEIAEVDHDGKKQRRMIQTASFQPHGMGGHIYWALVYPFHGFIFPTMARNLIRAAKSFDYHSNTPSLS